MTIVLVFIFGALIGSFLNVVILRLPNEESLTGRSNCMHCGHTLAWHDLIPVFSFILLRGRCRYCKAKISPRYPLIEIITGLLFAFAWQYSAPTTASFLEVARLWFIIASLIVIFTVDLEHYLILDKVIFPGCVVLAVLNILDGNFVSSLLAAASLTAPFYALWYFSKGKWLGFGDVKLAIFLGLALGWPLILPGLMISVILGGAVSVFLLLLTSSTLKTRVPFGTFLSLGALVTLFYGNQLVFWYLSLLGYN